MLAILSSCCPHPHSEAYKEQYAYLKTDIVKTPTQQSDYILVILVDARHLDYSNNYSLLKTLAKHPSDGSKNGDVGHAWIYLKGVIDGKFVEIEGGHSGELGVFQPKYFEGILNYCEYGYADPTPQQKLSPRYEPNPVKYLWATQKDGFFQKGSGNHTPTFAAKFNISKEQFHQILALMEIYPYAEYSLTDNQCCVFIDKVAKEAGIDLEYEVKIPLDPILKLGNEKIRFWTNPQYAELKVGSPDKLEKSLIQAVNDGRAEYALDWYQKQHQPSGKERILSLYDKIKNFPHRFQRYLLMQSAG